MGNIKKYSFFMISRVIIFLNIIIPKKNQIYFFSTSLYKDNISAVLDKAIYFKLNENYRFILDGESLKDYNIYNSIYVIHYSLRSLYYYLTSKYVFFDNGIYSNRYIKSQISVNVWHGTALKKIGNFCSSYNKANYRTSTFFITYSRFFVKKMSYAFNIPQKDILVTGEPRNDYFYGFNKSILSKILPDSENFLKIIFWMPTYRKSNFAESKNDGKNYYCGIPLIEDKTIHKFNEFLKSNNIVIIYKYHSLQQKNEHINNLSNFKFISSEDISKTELPLYSFISQIDGLITDYSSIYINYLSLNKPICFAYDDIKEYHNTRGFMFDNVEQIMPGYKATSLNNLEEFLSSVVKGEDMFEAERIKVNRILNSYNDANNSKRILVQTGLLDE